MNKIFDIIIIGGGAAGMMAAISARRKFPTKSIAIIDRTFTLGRKILICGAGRCNITNINLDKNSTSSYYGAKHEFIKSIFDQFTYKDIVTFFNELGVELYVERKTDIGKLFPVTNQAKTITEMMLDEITRNKIQIFLNTEVTNVVKNNKFIITTKSIDNKRAEAKGFASRFECNQLIISAGGKTYPALGSNGSGYNLLQDLGHNIIEPIPAALPLEGSNALTHLLQGQKTEIEVTSIIDDKEIKTRADDVMFTKYGLSGPAILNISREISVHFHREKKNNAAVKLNFFPGKSREEVEKTMNIRWAKRPEQSIEKSLYGLFPNKIAAGIIKYQNLPQEKNVCELSKIEKDKLIEALTNTRIKITGTRGWNEAEFTAGGVDSNEINLGTLLSKKVPGLYICGEIIDVDGDVGGFNLSWSWASGYVAGLLQ